MGESVQKRCNKCGEHKPLTEEFWYVHHARKGHPKDSWQSHCRECWKLINRLNKLRIRLAKKSL